MLMYNDAHLAFIIAKVAHAGQTDKQGNPYIQHPLRVADLADRMWRTAGETGNHAQVVGLLHDVIEDSGVCLHTLESLGIPKDCVQAINYLTRRDYETYFEYIEEIAHSKSPLVAKIVKTADLVDNLSRPFPGMSQSLVDRYRKALDKLYPVTNYVPAHLMRKVQKND